MGVDVFFVLSGYLITGLLVAEVERTSRLNLLQFYARRARRLLPAAALALIVTLLLGAVILAPNEIVNAGRAARATSLYLSNMFFARNAADYFAPDVSTNPMLHTWSLGVEEQFYLFWPLLIVLGLGFLRSKRSLVTLMALLTVASLAACLWLTANRGAFAFYALPARAWEFGLGGLAVLLPLDKLRVPAIAWVALGWLGVIGILASAYLISGATPFPGWTAAAPVLATVAALIGCAHQPTRGANLLLGSPPLQTLGTLSYSWYLWHWPFLVFAAALFPGISIAGKVVAGIASLGVAAIAHHFVENPIRFNKYLVSRPALTLSLAAILTVCSFATAMLFIQVGKRAGNRPDMRAITAAAEDIGTMPRQQCVVLGESADVLSCRFGNPASSTQLALFGDSHAIQWFNPLRHIAETRGWGLTTFVKSGCPATDVNPRAGSTKFSENCAAWRKAAMREIVALHPSIVIVGNYTRYPGSDNVDAWREATKRTLRVFADSGVRVAVLHDTPSFPMNVPTCLARVTRHQWYRDRSCDMKRSTALNDEIADAEKIAARDLPGVRLVDMTDQLCDDDVCRTVQRDLVMYRDDHHLTGRFAETLAAPLEARLLPLLDGPS